MIHEFAVDPEALAGWQNFRYLVEKFGVPHGRLISRFPAKWKKMVYEACSGCSEIERKRIEEGLTRIDPKLYNAGRTYDGTMEWVPNARTSHAMTPFRAIITVSGNVGPEGMLDIETLSEEDEAWAVTRGSPVMRTAANMAAAAEILLRCSAEIVFVDPHFGGESRFGKPLTAMIHCACSGRVPRRFEYHLCAEAVLGDVFRRQLEQQRSFLRIPAGVKLVFVRWNQMEAGDTLHPRYILTEKGGLRFDHGLDEGKPGETTDVECLDQTIHTLRWSQFQPGSGHFELVDAWIMTTTDTVRATWDGTAFAAEK